MPTDAAATAHLPLPRPAVRARAGNRLLTALIAIVLLAALPIGAVQPWAWGTLTLAVAAMLAVFALGIAGGRRPAVSARRLWFPAACFAAAMGWAIVQALPVTPQEWHHPLWAATADLLEMDIAGAVALNPAQAIDTVLRLTTYAAIFYLALNLCRAGGWTDRAVTALSLGIACYSAYGIAAYASGTETILWYAKSSYLGDLTGTFINRNSHATFAGLGALCAAALLLHGAGRAGRGDLPTRERFRRITEHMTGPGAIHPAAFFLSATSILLSHSRAGLASFLISLAALGLLMAFARRTSVGRALVLGAATVPLLLVIVGLAGSGTLTRVLHVGEDGAVRLRIFERTVEAIEDAPRFGTGLGSFPDLFQLYRTADLRDPFVQAHNSYLENVMELGVPAAVFLFAALAAPAGLCALGVMRRRRDVVFPCLGLAATILVAVHSLVDFSLQIPAVAAAYALLVGACCAQTWSSRIDVSA